jgi:two-component system cell cycle sensor histidine kinase/response regulator CckA
MDDSRGIVAVLEGPERPAHERDSHDAVTARAAKVLIVDDQPFYLRLLERILVQGGYTSYRSVSDSRQTASAYREFQPDLILLDMMMPHLDGVEVMEQLRPLMEGTYVPVLVLTADVATEARRRALRAGAKDFLTKPLDEVEVLLRIQNLLETRFLYQRLQQRANRRIEEQAALLDRANDAILVADMDDRILYWNQGAERLYGWKASEALGNVFQTLFHRGPPAELDEAQQTVVKEGKWEGELRQLTKDGREVIVAARWTLVRDDEGRPKSRLVINTDITEKKKLEAQLLQAQRLEAVALLAGGVAHDFNNLLMVIIGCSELALTGLDREPASQIHKLLEEIRRAGERAASLTRQLLAFSRKQVLSPVTLDLNALVSDTQKMLARLIGEDIVLTTVLDPSLGQVRADPGQVEQVLMNLVVNARDAMPTAGRITIETRNIQVDSSRAEQHAELQRGSYVQLAVSDTGCGMDEATKSRIFEPFFTTKEVGKGTGLGLSTVYGIVNQSGGFIEVDSAPGRGTTFRINLPRLAQPEVGINSGSPGAHGLPRGTGMVLLVEDEEGVRSLEGLALRSAGYTVLEARDGEEALGLYLEHPGSIDLLVSDVVMPKMSGPQLVDRLAGVRPGLKVLYTSGYTRDTVVRHGVQDAGKAFLQKPFTPSALAREVHRLLGH